MIIFRLYWSSLEKELHIKIKKTIHIQKVKYDSFLVNNSLQLNKLYLKV